MTTELILTRRQHDALFDADHALLVRLFAESKSRKWSLAGVTFVGLPADLVVTARAAIA